MMLRTCLAPCLAFVAAAVLVAAPVAAHPSDRNGPWPWPLAPPPAVVAAFDPPESDYGSGHRGIDLAGTPGQRVLAATPGVVTVAGPVADRGVVVVRYDDRRLTYEPVAAAVDVGQHVAAGDLLGSLSATGSHCWPESCLHVGLRRGDHYLDPLPWFGALPVRLKPLEPASQAKEGATGTVDGAIRLGGSGGGRTTAGDVRMSEPGSWVSRGRTAAGGAAVAAAALLTLAATRRGGQARG